MTFCCEHFKKQFLCLRDSPGGHSQTDSGHSELILLACTINNVWASSLRQKASLQLDFNSHEISPILECYSSLCAIFTDDNRERQLVSELWYSNPSFEQNNASLMVRKLCFCFKLSDVAMKELYTMLHCFVPPGNIFQSDFAAVSSSKIRLDDFTAAAFETTNGRVCVLKFSDLIQAVVERNFKSIANYNAER